MVPSRSEDSQSQKYRFTGPSLIQKQATLQTAISHHIAKEGVSFHTPGHKGRKLTTPAAAGENSYLTWDLTELPGLDELYQPTGVLSSLEKRAAKVWGAHASFLSVNGASAGLIAAIIALSRRGSKLLVPRNCHRSVVHALILTGLQPIWFEPIWEADWGIWGDVQSSDLATALKENGTDQLAGAVIVSPTYAGALSNVKEIAELCHAYDVPVLVDEAHGAHLLLSSAHQSSLNSGADLVVHSLHKILGGMTQTGLLHLSEQAVKRFAIAQHELRMALNLVQSSSPSYVLMSSIDATVSALESASGLQELERIEQLGISLRDKLERLQCLKLYRPSSLCLPTHLLLGCGDPQALYSLLSERGIYLEGQLGLGLLLLLGIGTSELDLNDLVNTLSELEISHNGSFNHESRLNEFEAKPIALEQKLNPKSAFYERSCLVPANKAIGQIAAECVAPCPPGWPVLIPGQRIEADTLRWHDFKSIRVVVQSS